MKLIILYCWTHWKNINLWKMYIMRQEGGGGEGYCTCLKKKRWVLVHFPHSTTPLLWVKGFTVAQMSWFIVWCISLRGAQPLNSRCFIWLNKPFDTWYGSDSLAGSKYWDIQSKSIPHNNHSVRTEILKVHNTEWPAVKVIYGCGSPRVIGTMKCNSKQVR